MLRANPLKGVGRKAEDLRRYLRYDSLAAKFNKSLPSVIKGQALVLLKLSSYDGRLKRYSFRHALMEGSLMKLYLIHFSVRWR